MTTEQSQSPSMPTGRGNLSGVEFDIYEDPIELPVNEARRAVCAQHIADGCANDLITNFYIAGCHFPEGDQEKAIRYGLSCSGPGRLTKSCKLKLTQRNSEGKVLTSGGYH